MEKVSWVPSTDSTKASPKCDPGWLSIKLRMLFSSYRIDQYPDPDGFLAQAGIVLGEYDPQIVAIVTSPLTGIQRKLKYPPTIAELVEECDRVRDEIGAEAKRRASPRIVFKPPERRDRPKPGEDYDSMFAKYGRPIGFFE
jgi:hypothetical protein